MRPLHVVSFAHMSLDTDRLVVSQVGPAFIRAEYPRKYVFAYSFDHSQLQPAVESPASASAIRINNSDLLSFIRAARQ